VEYLNVTLANGDVRVSANKQSGDGQFVSQSGQIPPAAWVQIHLDRFNCFTIEPNLGASQFLETS
jgi:hypothetical protein